MIRRIAALSALILFSPGCSSDDPADGDEQLQGDGGTDGGTQTGDGGTQTGDGGTQTGDGGTDAGPGDCEALGKFGPPGTTFTLPGPNAGGELYVPDVQKSFPAVDWKTLDRLYIPAGNYTLINLGNLPNRDASRRLVITNTGGQVVIRPKAGSTQGYIWSITGGSNWVLTGRYDAESGTGHADFQGHRCGKYANSRGRYGILSDDIFLSGGHMGLGIGGANSFEVEFLEIMRAGFAGLRINNSAVNGVVPPLNDIKLHDLYIHDTASEAIYFGSTQGAPTPLGSNLKVYNNRLVRTGTESLQIQNLGDGTEVHHNVFAFGAIDWRAAFQGYQDNNSQAQVRAGHIRFHHNVFVGGAASLLNFFVGPEAGDLPLNVEFTDNYFADTLWLGIYVGGNSGSTAATSKYLWERNAFRGLDFGYNSVYPTTTDPGVIFSIASAVTSPITLKENRWEGPRKLVGGLTGGSGTAGVVTASGNVNAAVPALTFVDTGLPAGTTTRKLERWTPKATLAPGQPEMTYAAGALVMHDAQLYRARVQNTNKVPSSSPTEWELLSLPVDDLRTAPGNEWAERGVGLLPVSP
ncbi:carbohydrate-binding protein [Myxococcus sp. K15C18031901]|uniref:carbohydrate-binding protein n=1 Tax=Myxococcus dinghuensis TaxID=2906761 RepID=UPI0020A72EC2|nr:carbohydrate-binding protein [Myxococcus dinghuensis]MCP3100262.1 carbohydrate-binding protein [Myxococcus dinghuensis]